MTTALERNLLFIREIKKWSDPRLAYDILDPENGATLLECREAPLKPLVKFLRFTDFKRMTPFKVTVSAPSSNSQLLHMERGVPVAKNYVRVFDSNHAPIGGFQLRSFSIGGDFDVFDAVGAQVCVMTAGLTGLNIRFATTDGVELAHISRKWGGLGRELFHGAGDHMLHIDPAVPTDSLLRRLILAAVICIGMVTKVDT